MMKKSQLFLLTIWFLVMSMQLYGQEARKYEGVILNADTRSPLAGVSVKVKNAAVQSDEQGKFTIQGNQGESLTASLLGYESVSINLASTLSLQIEMREVSSDLEGVVVIGYGTAKKSDLTGSVVRINMADKALQANTNLLQSLIGATSGVNLESRGGASSEPSLSIRGQTSLSASDRPLIVLDGVIYNGSINNINMNDVESVDILKDASAAAVYGSRAANGVMLITTKKGKTEKPVISFNTYAGVQDMTNNPMRVMDGDEFAVRLVDWDWQSKVYNWYKTKPTDASTRPVRPDVTDRNVVANYLRTLEEKENYLAGKSIDWVDEVLQTAPMQYYNLSLQGKSDMTNYYLSGSYSDVEGVQLNDRMKRITMHSNIESRVNEWLKINLNTSFSNIDNSGIPASLATARKASPLVNNHIGQDDYDIYLGGELFQPYPLIGLYVDNSDVSKEFFGVGGLRIDAPWVKGLAYDFNYSYVYSSRNNNTFYSSKTPEGVSNRGAAVKSPSEGKDWAINNILSYSNTFGKHQINSTLLLSTEGRTGNGSTLNASGFNNEILGYNNMGLGEVATVGSSAYKENSISYMARANYSFMSRYLFTATIRRDGFSGFGETNKWANFPSASVAWVLSEEPFFKPEDVYLKIRTSYGKNGNQGIGRYSSQSRMGTRDYVYGQNTAIGIYPSTLGNIELGWETTSSINAGIDFGFLKNRITGALDLYSSKTSDILVRRKLPRMAGYADIWTNIGATSNKGIELDIKSLNLTGAFRWETSLTFALNRDKLTRLYGDGNDSDIGNSWFVGKSLGAIYDYEMAGGVWTEDEFFRGEVLEGWYPGQFKYVDQGTKDNVIDPTNDRTVIGYTSPSYRFSINNTFSYKNFSLSVFINSIQGGSNRYMANNVENANPLYYFPDRHNNSAVNPYWSPLAPTTNTTGIYNVPLRQSGIYQSRSFVRIQDISLGYSFKNELLKKLNMQNAQIYVSSKNPYVWTKWQGWDPESGASDIPVMRNVVVGLNVSF
ncbi:SusC/RagA family TonB-linked outer membrane protein [Sphingobacteruim zhuxiongii]|nr:MULTISPECIES: SusC/RagA family TonB-linked outer membrane protein [unclassified Sphingobacterium]